MEYLRAMCALVVALIVGTSSVVAAVRLDHAGCADVTLVFARGSGQHVNDLEARVFFGGVLERVGPDVSVTTYELGTEHGGAGYAAVGGPLDMLEAELSWTGFLGGGYRASVAAGVAELTSYLAHRTGACPGESFVVGGYSQGAQVVGEALFELPAATRERIAFVALFSDPKLHLPEGRGPFPPACRGEASPWRRGKISCWADNGVLESRKPYLPEDIADRTGSWCDRDDGVCNGNLIDLALSRDHSAYAHAGAEIDEAAREIASVLDR